MGPMTIIDRIDGKWVRQYFDTSTIPMTEIPADELESWMEARFGKRISQAEALEIRARGGKGGHA